MTKTKRRIYICDTDLDQLERLVVGPGRWGSRGGGDREFLQTLEAELKRATVVSADEMPRDVVIMGASVRVTDLDDGQQRTFTLVLPGEANTARNKISILAPIGIALLGYRRGDTVEWHFPGGRRRLRIDAIVSHPEARRESEPV